MSTKNPCTTDTLVVLNNFNNFDTFYFAFSSKTYHTDDSKEQRASENHVRSTSFLQTEIEKYQQLVNMK